MKAQGKTQVTIYSTSDQIRTAIRTAFSGSRCEVLEVTDSTKAPRNDINEEQQEGAIGRLELPDRADGVVTRTGLNSKVEGLAATLGLKQGRNDVYAYVLPEALPALRDKLERLGSLVLVGGDQAK